MKKSIAVALTFIAVNLLPSLAAAGAPDVAHETRLFIDAYVHGDSKTVLAFIDPNVVVFGSDEAEVLHGAAAVNQMLEDDLKLWGGTARFDSMEHVSIIESGDIASIFFDAGFSVGNRPAVPVRFAMVWHRSVAGWKLVQSSNVVPTEGKSAAELLKSINKEAH